jgi:hypothetical protein
MLAHQVLLWIQARERAQQVLINKTKVLPEWLI